VSRPAPRSIGAALGELNAALAPATTLARVQAIWERAAGEAIAAAARPSAEREGVLTVSCEAAIWAQELTLMADELLTRLNTALGEDVLRELRCRTA
jgi:predicted nucleic acid-binding Zn ribbon protein